MHEKCLRLRSFAREWPWILRTRTTVLAFVLTSAAFLTDGVLLASGPRDLSVVLTGENRIATLEAGGVLVVQGSISNYTGKPVEILEFVLSADVVPRKTTDTVLTIAPALLSVLEEGSKIPANGYTGPLFSIGIPTNSAPKVSVFCQFGVTWGTNEVWESVSELTLINPPTLKIAANPSGQLSLVWSNSFFRPVYGTNLLPDMRWRNVAGEPISNGEVFSLSIDRPYPYQFFRLEEP